MDPVLSPVFQKLSGRAVPWLDPADKIILGYRIQLSRNVDKIPFPICASENMLESSAEIIRSALPRKFAPWKSASLRECSAFDLDFLKERGMIGTAFAEQSRCRHVHFTADQKFVLLVNGEDHLIIQGFAPGGELNNLADQMQELDDALCSRFPAAFHRDHGFLTSDPGLSGTGMRISVLLHIPGLLLAGQEKELKDALAALHCRVEGFLGKEPGPAGSVFQITNQISLGDSEQEIADKMETIASRIAQQEFYARNKLASLQPELLLNICGRAMGLVRYSYRISMAETVQTLSALRLGCDLGIFRNCSVSTINHLLLTLQPAHLSLFCGQTLSEDECMSKRAELLRATFSGKSGTAKRRHTAK